MALKNISQRKEALRKILEKRTANIKKACKPQKTSLNPFLADAPILYPLKTPENPWLKTLG